MAEGSKRAARPRRSGFAMYPVQVVKFRHLSPHMVRITFRGERLDRVGRVGLDQRIKVFFPENGQPVCDLGQSDPVGGFENWYQTWREMDPQIRTPFRTYTAKASRPETKEMDIDFVDHGPVGAAGRWLRTLAVGQETLLLAPDINLLDPPLGIEWAPPASAKSLLLVGDETALPAIDSILTSLGGGAASAVTALVEIAQPEDALPVEGCQTVVVPPESITIGEIPQPEIGQRGIVIYLPRGAAGAEPKHFYGQRMVQGTELLLQETNLRPDYVWVAGEAGGVTSIRRQLIRRAGITRDQITFMGYWRHGEIGH